MDEGMPLASQPKTRAEYRAAIQEMLNELRRLMGEMDKDYPEMERKRIEFDTIGARTDANLRALEEQLQRLREPRLTDGQGADRVR